MFIMISPSNPDPMHRQVTDQVKDAIARGTLKAGEKLPSIREMSRELGISAREDTEDGRRVWDIGGRAEKNTRKAAGGRQWKRCLRQTA
jgi:DNA-binding transcriptional MocR family regulator